MSGEPDVRTDLIVGELLSQWPAAAGVFIRFRMACVGCPLAAFETLQAAATNYRLEPKILAGAIGSAIASSGSTNFRGGR